MAYKLSKREKVNRYEDQWLGHLFAKSCAFGVNVAVLILTLIYWEYGTKWDKYLNHAILGTLPVNLMAILTLVIANKYSREMSLVHDVLCLGVCLPVSIMLFLLCEICANIPLLIFILGAFLAFDLAIHAFTENEIIQTHSL